MEGGTLGGSGTSYAAASPSSCPPLHYVVGLIADCLNCINRIPTVCQITHIPCITLKVIW